MRTNCRACETGALEQFINLGSLPLAGAFLSGTSAIGDEKLYPLAVHVCRTCGLVQVLDAVDPKVLFQDYSFSSSTIKPLVDHFDAYADWLMDRLKPQKVVEFGCNDGILLEPLQRRGATAVGIDVSENITDLARSKGLTVITGFFNTGVAKDLRQEYGAFDLVTGSNAFAHNDRPDTILEAAAEVLDDSGHLCLEFMYAGDLLDQLQWDTLYHEHLTFYSLSTIGVLLRRYGFFVVDATHLPMHGGSLRVLASRRESTPSANAQSLLKQEDQSALNVADTWHGFGKRSMRKIEIVRDIFRSISRDKEVWAYGAAGKATMWVNAAEMSFLGAVVDASPLRAGKLMPGTHTPIVFPENFRATPPDHVFVTAWNYADLIRSKEQWFQGTWSTPLPNLRFF